MLSHQITKWGELLEAREEATPKPEGTEVLVRVEACGVCHSDLHNWDGYFDLSGSLTLRSSKVMRRPPPRSK